ncbi:delta(1)-pyrroline-2-carboxylate reductase family protein [Noviherbaspirillum sp. Root189]|uniref:delta(1)-pyrroline-2-carboxylate reductase family protein n=1 Tax=Noviherbaspirillum sp. Root189 TaxID=1736487 RepID=UPI000708A59B|nr:delta(1)-pyrroline-2-carboxylate reductase family protein [Noviherbaspirillum sp. Root189]KRB89936.1 ornithine cyclodeaminase [Noviherbaspirillum sp. Root189]
MQIFNAADTANALPYTELVPAIALAARQRAEGSLHAPERQVVPVEGGVLLCMPAVADDIGVTKLITVHNGNASHGLPAIQGEVIVFDTATGRRLALLDGPTVTARRTAAVTLLGIQTLLPKRPASALLIGTGVQSSAHAEALHQYFGLTSLHVAARSIESTEKFCAGLNQSHAGMEARAVTLEQLTPEQLGTFDVVIALTTSTVPVIPANIAPHTLAIGVGAFKPNMAEFPPELVHARTVVVDDLEGAKHEAGDLLQAGVDWSGVRSLADVLPGGSVSTAALPIFKTVGQAAWDLAAARVATARMTR